MNILIIAHYIATPDEKANNRFNYIANLLAEKNEVEIVTSSFSHINKCQRNIKEEQIKNLNYKLTTIYEPGYKKNVSMKRIFSHYIIAKNLKKYLSKLNYKPDVIYCAVPSLDIARVSAKYAKKNKIRFIIDIQDLWPEAFKMVFNIPIISNMIFYPMKRTANYIYKQADDIVAVSNTYMERAEKVNRKYRNKLSVFLGTDLNYFDKCKNENEQKYNDEFIRLVYVGTLGSSYDLKCVIDALDILNHKGINNIKFIMMGKGPLQEEFEEYAKKKNVNCEFTGLLSYDKMVGNLCSCDIAVNPISKGAAQSIINKVGDYAMAGLPVISTQENEEYRKLVEEYNIGFNCKNGNSKDVAEKIEILYNDMDLRQKMGKNNRKLAEEKFDRNKTYKKIIKLIEGDYHDNITH